MTNLFLENFLFYWFMQKRTSAGLAYLRLLVWSCMCLWMAGTVRLILLSVAHDSFFSFSPRPVPGSLSSLLHLHNRQRQPMPASMPGTLPNPTMPGSSAVLMPVSFLVCFSVGEEDWFFAWFNLCRAESLLDFLKNQSVKEAGRKNRRVKEAGPFSLLSLTQEMQLMAC